MQKLSLAMVAVAALSLGAVLVATRAEAAADPQSAALDVLPLRRMTIELKQVSGANFFRIVGDVAGAEITTDQCVAETKIDLKMKNAPVRWVFAAVATQLELRYQLVDGKLHVTCE